MRGELRVGQGRAGGGGRETSVSTPPPPPPPTADIYSVGKKSITN